MVSGALWALLLCLAALLVVCIVLLVTPVKLGLGLRTAPEWRSTVALRLLGGLAPPIPIHDSARRKPGQAPAAKRKKATSAKAADRRRRAVTRGARVIAAAPHLMMDLLRPIRLERLRIDADVGLTDPADTGQLFGLFAAVTQSRQPGSVMSIEVRPDFTGPRASGELDAEVGFVPAAFLPPGIRLAWRVFGPAR